MIGSRFVRFPLLGNKSQIQQPTVFGWNLFATISEPVRGGYDAWLNTAESTSQRADRELVKVIGWAMSHRMGTNLIV